MSVLEATIFYTRTYTRDLRDDVLTSGQIISYPKRRIILYITIGSICLLGALYVYLVGSVVGSGFAQEKLRTHFNALREQVQNIEHTALQKEKTFTVEFFVSRGYYEPRVLEAITRTRDVAEAPQDGRFY